MYKHFLGGITTETNVDLILSSLDNECFQIDILFLVSAQYVSSSSKNRITEHYPDLQVISQQELSIDIVNACFYSTAVLQTEVQKTYKTYQSSSLILCQG